MSAQNGWTLERRMRQAALIRTWKPWKRATGPRSAEGKAKVARNPWTGGHRQQFRELARLVNDQLGRTRNLVLTELAAAQVAAAGRGDRGEGR